ncbi:MAG: hypothetical protein ACI86H_001003 [bacterium]|jgi:hypothetical protein
MLKAEHLMLSNNSSREEASNMGMQCDWCGKKESKPLRKSRPKNSNMYKCVHCEKITYISGFLSRQTSSSKRNDSIGISIQPNFYQDWLKPKLSSFYEKNPKISLKIDQTNRCANFQSDNIHLAIRYGRGGWSGLQSKNLFERDQSSLQGRYYIVLPEQNLNFVNVKKIHDWLLEQGS